MDNYELIKWSELQKVDLCVREVQLSLENIKKYNDCESINTYNNYLEEMRSTIHSKMKELEKIK